MRFAVGDLVVGIPSSECDICTELGLGDTNPEMIGKVFRVLATWEDRYGEHVSVGYGAADQWCAGCFRRLNDEPDNVEIVERIKCPAREEA